MLKHVVRALFLLLLGPVLVVGLSGSPAHAAAAPFEPGGDRAVEQMPVSVPIVYAKDTWLYNGGLNQACYTTVLIYFADIKGWEPQLYRGTLTAPGYPPSSYSHVLAPPYDDSMLFHDQTLNQPGMHKVALQIVSKTSSMPFQNCETEAATQQASYGSSLTVYYGRSGACLKAQDSVTTAQDKLKAAKKALKRADTAAEKRKAKKKKQKAKKKLAKAEAVVAQLC
ncbi:MAG TPA: hypothetical protein PLZ93_08790 [Nocardioides sp.]|uniref:hypothetical protein n=1 Tax=uncultured Nocardioides sp. TaxID=198441 RepID=UPI000ED96EB3|nr:hypothetical protein [uncultured Nocardioides sp.]HCB07778.1 hypothetical protein [Nocardioides sp.]HRD62423.1 hypothetical protein [Nocardioides sp.]HRI95696.1 hypothetical protein [Nocardioides sp.]HRK47643.1 hypothetical protein [Nocardioides sp.]